MRAHASTVQITDKASKLGAIIPGLADGWCHVGGFEGDVRQSHEALARADRTKMPPLPPRL